MSGRHFVEKCRNLEKPALTDEQLNKRLHEMVGICWHDLKSQGLPHWYICKNCKSELHGDVSLFQIDFVHSWEGFGIMWEFMQKHERWAEFMNFILIKQELQHFKNNTYYKYWWYFIVNPSTLAKAVGRFFEEVIINSGSGDA